MLISKGPVDWHSGHEPGLTSLFCDWKKGPTTNEHLTQSYLTMLSCGRTPVQLVTTPVVLINKFRWSCLVNGLKIIIRNTTATCDITDYHHHSHWWWLSSSLSSSLSPSLMLSSKPNIILLYHQNQPERSNFLDQRQIGDSHVDRLHDLLIPRIHGKHDIFCSLSEQYQIENECILILQTPP